MNRPGILLSSLLLSFTAPGPVAHAQPAPAASTTDGPPDPRLGERLDGRPAPADPRSGLRTVGRVVLVVPRLLIESLFWPVVRVASFVEGHHLAARTYWALTSEDRLVGVRPEARYETGFLTSFGARFFDRRTLGPGSLVQLRAHTAGRGYALAELRLRPSHGSVFVLEQRVLYERSTDKLFAGTHGEGRAELLDAGRGLAYYGMDRALSDVNLHWQIARPVLVALGGAVDLRTYRSTGSLEELYCAEPGAPSCAGVDEMLVPGFDQGLRLLRGNTGLLVDSRHGRRRRGGVRFVLDGAVAHGVMGDPSAHLRVVADARLVLDLSDRALIVRVNAGLVRPLGDAPVPFEELMSPSGTEGLRGLSSGRLRGHSQVLGSLEYRWLLAPYLDAALFVDQGGAFDRGFTGLSLDRMIPSYGFGLRIHEIRGDYWNAAPLVRLQVAHAPGEGTRLMVSLGAGD